MKRPSFPCSGCRQVKQLVHHVARMGYCELCKHKAPKSEKEYYEYIHQNSPKNINLGFTIQKYGEHRKDIV